MKPLPLLIYAHIHRRKTGVTTSVAQVLPGFDGTRFELYTYGARLVEGVERLGALALVRKLKGRAAIWHAHRNNEVMVGLLYRIFFPRLKVVATRHSATPPSWITRWLLQRADAVIGLTPDSVRHLPGGATVIPHGVDLERYHPADRKGSSLPGVAQEKLIGVVGRVRREKGQDVLLSAVAPLLAEKRDWGVVILGRVKPSQQAYRQKLERIALDAGVEGQLHFIDEVADPADYYRAFDILAVPSLTEGFSMVTLEGMASGCAPVASKGVGIHDEVIEEGVSGWLVPPGDVAALRDALERAMADPELVARVGEAARAAVVADWSVAREVERLSEFYLSLPGRRKGSSGEYLV